MRGPALLLVVLGALALAGCGGEKVVTPTGPVEGPLPTTTAATAKGNAAAGKQVFAANGCGGCHTYKPAGASGTQGPDLDKLPELAQKANQGPLDQFVHESIVNPSAYVEKGFSDIMPKNYGQSLNQKQLADVVAFLTTKT
jgi:mono/diheme cytochrome c family protein